MTSTPPPPDHDPDWSRFTQDIVDLAERRAALGPNAFLERVSELEARFGQLRKYRSDPVLAAELERFAARRFQLVDEAAEYVLAAEEVLVASMVLGEASGLALPALKRSIELLSQVLGESGVPRAFGQLLKRLRELARQAGDSEMQAWVAGVVSALPDA